MIRRCLLKLAVPALVLTVLFSAGTVLAAYEPVNPQSSVGTSITPVPGPAEDIDVSWTAPEMSGDDSIVEYVYKWTTSATPLDDGELNRETNDGVVSKDLEPILVTTPASFFADDDEDTIRHLHIKTVYLVLGDGDKFSNDVVVGPFNFDNVAPGGTAVLDADAPGQTETSSSLNPVTINVSVTSAYEAKVYLSNSATRPDDPAATFENEATLEHTIADWVPGQQTTVSYWLEDSAGNVSDRKLLTFNMVAGKSVAPAGDLNLNIGATQIFTIDGKGGSETFNWAIINADPDDGSVASFAGGNTAVPQVEIRGDGEGAFQVQATSNDDTLVYTSGTITVVQSTFSKTFNLITTATTNTNTIGFIFENTGITTAHELGDVIGNCSQVSRWDAVTQSYSSHRMQFAGTNNFALNVGEAYFVTVTTEQEFTLTGTLPASHSHTLITTATTNTNAVGVPYSKSAITLAHDLGSDIGNCSQVSRWDATTQSYSSHRMQFATTNNFAVEWGQGYFITVTTETAWPW